MITLKDIDKDLQDYHNRRMGHNSIIDAIDRYSEEQAKEAVKEFTKQMMSIVSDTLASDIVLHIMTTIKHLAKEKGIEI